MVGNSQSRRRILIDLLAPTWTSRWCRRGMHWMETAADARVWDGMTCPDCRLARKREKYAADPEPARAYLRAQRAANLERERARDRARHAANPQIKRAQARRRYWANPERYAEYNRQYYKTDAGKLNRLRSCNKRRVAVANAICEHGEACFDIAAVALPQRCAVPGCRRKDIQADHILPLALGGLHCRLNLQPLCGHHNASKRASDPIEFARRNGMLF